MGLLSAPLAAALLMQWWADEEPGAAQGGAAFILVTWFLAAVYAAYDGLRFLQLLAPPFGIACAVSLGRLYAWVKSLAHGTGMWYRAVVYVLLWAVLTLTLCNHCDGATPPPKATPLPCTMPGGIR